MFKFFFLLGLIGSGYCLFNCLVNGKDLTKHLAQKWSQAFPDSPDINYCSLMISGNNQQVLQNALKIDNSTVHALLNKVLELDPRFYIHLRSALRKYEESMENLRSREVKELVKTLFEITFYNVANQGAVIIALRDPRNRGQLVDTISREIRVAELVLLLEKAEKLMDLDMFVSKFPLLAEGLIPYQLPNYLKQKLDEAKIRDISLNKSTIASSVELPSIRTGKNDPITDKYRYLDIKS